MLQSEDFDVLEPVSSATGLEDIHMLIVERNDPMRREQTYQVSPVYHRPLTADSRCATNTRLSGPDSQCSYRSALGIVLA